ERALRRVAGHDARRGVGAGAGRPAHPRPHQRGRRGDRRAARGVRGPGRPGDRGAAAQHRRGGQRRPPGGRRGRGGGRRRGRRAAPGGRPDGHRPDQRRHAPVRGVVDGAADRLPALRRADRAHPVVGAADAHLGRARARGHHLGAQGAAHPRRAAQPLPAPAGALGVVAVLGAQRHRVRLEPGAAVPAAAHGGAAVPVHHLGRAGGLRRRPAGDRGDRPGRRDPLGHPPLAAPGHPGGAGLRRGAHAPGARGADGAGALPGRRPGRAARGGRDAADDAAVARAGEQVARRPVRAGRRGDPRRQGARAAGHRRPRRPADPAGAGGGAAGVPGGAGLGGGHPAAGGELPAPAGRGGGVRGRPRGGGGVAGRGAGRAGL
ncbi:MAG: Carboxylate-amine ligase, partial [uncultured Quadrisphaera sp.]